MRPKKPQNRDLPPRMLRRIRKRKKGPDYICYFYSAKGTDGKQVKIPLGTDLDIAKIEWAKLDRKAVPKVMKLLGSIFDRYDRDIIPTKKASTQRENRLSLKQLRAAFADAPPEAITPHVCAQYRDARTAKVRANRELALLSHIYNIGREWGVITCDNPVTGVRKNKETPREFYATEEIWSAVYKKGASELRDAMDLAYLSAQRPADVLSMRETDATLDYLQVSQGKTAKKLRIKLTNANGANELGTLVERLLRQRKERGARNPYLIVTEDGRNVTKAMLRLRFDEARRLAAATAIEALNHKLAADIKSFQFRDIRPKAASEIEDLAVASKLLGHSDKRITETVYRRVGEIVSPTK
ncbi:tyrosine-type recombinase/integrase [Pseudomonas asplenii]|nr:tyrosine-type recombinase/integrase [Pseudomonas asplenii]